MAVVAGDSMKINSLNTSQNYPLFEKISLKLSDNLGTLGVNGLTPPVPHGTE